MWRTGGKKVSFSDWFVFGGWDVQQKGASKMMMHRPHACRELSLAGTDIVVVGLQEVEMGTASVFRYVLGSMESEMREEYFSVASCDLCRCVLRSLCLVLDSHAFLVGYNRFF